MNYPKKTGFNLYQIAALCLYYNIQRENLVFKKFLQLRTLSTNKNYKKCMFIVPTQTEMVSKMRNMIFFQFRSKLLVNLDPFQYENVILCLVFVYLFIFGNNENQKKIQNVILKIFVLVKNISCIFVQRLFLFSDYFLTG